MKNTQYLLEKTKSISNSISLIDSDIANSILNDSISLRAMVDPSKTIDREEVARAISRRLYALNENLQKIIRLQDDTEAINFQFKNNLSFWDKFLWGVFASEDVKTLKEALHKEMRTQRTIRHIIENEQRKPVFEDLKHSHRLKVEDLQLDNNPEYANLYLEKKKILNLEKDMHELIQKGERTIRQINSSKDMETLDMFTSNKAIGALSSMSNNDSSSKIRDFQKSVKEFIDHNTGELETLNIIDFAGEMLDFGTGFDLMMGFIQLDNLNNAKSNINDILEELETERTIISSNANKISDQMNKILNSKVTFY